MYRDVCLLCDGGWKLLFVAGLERRICVPRGVENVDEWISLWVQHCYRPSLAEGWHPELELMANGGLLQLMYRKFNTRDYCRRW